MGDNQGRGAHMGHNQGRGVHTGYNQGRGATWVMTREGMRTWVRTREGGLPWVITKEGALTVLGITRFPSGKSHFWVFSWSGLGSLNVGFPTFWFCLHPPLLGFLPDRRIAWGHPPTSSESDRLAVATASAVGRPARGSAVSYFPKGDDSGC